MQNIDTTVSYNGECTVCGGEFKLAVKSHSSVNNAVNAEIILPKICPVCSKKADIKLMADIKASNKSEFGEYTRVNL